MVNETGAVAGRTAAQIESAKRKAVGGKRKRCVKGKSCSATCIASNKICMVDLPWVSSNGMAKVVKEIQSSAGKPKEKAPKSDFILSSGKAPTLTPIKTLTQFNDLLGSTSYAKDKEAEAYHNRIKDLLEGKNDKLLAFKESIIKRIGGQTVYQNAIEGIRMFTDEDDHYGSIRRAQRLLDSGRPIKPYDKPYAKLAQDVEKLVAKLPKEPVIKYRGIHVSDKQLIEILSQAKLKENFTDGALASWSTSLGVSKGFADRTKYGEENKIIFRTINRRGVAIDGISTLSGENEVLTSGTAKYKHTGRVSKIQSGSNTYYIIDVVES